LNAKNRDGNLNINDIIFYVLNKVFGVDQVNQTFNPAVKVDLGDNGITQTTVELTNVTLTGLDSFNYSLIQIIDNDTIEYDMGMDSLGAGVTVKIDMTPGANVESPINSLATELSLNFSLAKIMGQILFNMGILIKKVDLVGILEGNPLCALTLFQTLQMDNMVATAESLTGPIFSGSDETGKAVSSLLNSGVEAVNML